MSSMKFSSEEKNPDSPNDMNNAGFDYRETGETSISKFDYRRESEADEGMNQSIGIELGYLPPDQRPGIPGELLAQLVDPEIDDDTEAAEALRANANVKVGKVSKAARSLNAQSVRKLVKRATLRGQSGNRRGKPPRIPPGITSASAEDDDQAMFQVDEGSEGIPVTQRDNDSISSRDMEEDDSELKNKNIMRQDVGETIRRDEDSSVGPTNESKTEKQAQAGDETKDLPVEVVAATMEAGRKLMGSIDPHNMLQLQRWRRKNKKGDKKKRKSYVKGKVIDGRHELYTLSIAVMLGVRTSIAKTNTIIAATPRSNALTAQDFMAEEKYEFAPKGSATTPPHKLSHTFKFKDYAPLAFAYLRRMFGVNEFDFLLSVCGNANFIEVSGHSKDYVTHVSSTLTQMYLQQFISNAKSGQFFFYSSDGKYMIKTMTNAESKFLRRILPHYFRHCVQNPNTLLTKFLGMYRVKLYHLRRNVKFVIMNSVYYTDKSLQVFYDLKGSELGREAKLGEDVLKDNDLRRSLPEEAFSFNPEARERVKSQVVSDCSFLSKMQIMDYSMLIGVHHIPPKQADTRGSVAETGFRIRGLKERQLSLRSAPINHVGQSGSSDVAAKGEDANGFFQQGDLPTDYPKKESNGTKLVQSKADSSRKLIKDIRESATGMKSFEFAGLLDEEDDCSYLEGSQPFARHDSALNLARYQQHPSYDDVELKKEQTIEQIYWPFHRFYDINGLRRMEAKACFRCGAHPCTCAGHDRITKTWGIPEFVPPLSNRKDGGLMMDTSDLLHPMIFHGPKGDRLYEGKIFYMGIIDILQQYNARKRVETSFRKVENNGGLEPSCVSPEEYANRFVAFFEEYSQKAVPKPPKVDDRTEIETTLVDKAVINKVQVNVTESQEKLK